MLPQNLGAGELYGETDVIPLLGGGGDFRKVTGFKP